MPIKDNLSRLQAEQQAQLEESRMKKEQAETERMRQKESRKKRISEAEVVIKQVIQPILREFEEVVSAEDAETLTYVDPDFNFIQLIFFWDISFTAKRESNEYHDYEGYGYDADRFWRSGRYTSSNFVIQIMASGEVYYGGGHGRKEAKSYGRSGGGVFHYRRTVKLSDIFLDEKVASMLENELAVSIQKKEFQYKLFTVLSVSTSEKIYSKNIVEGHRLAAELPLPSFKQAISNYESSGIPIRVDLDPKIFRGITPR